MRPELGVGLVLAAALAAAALVAPPYGDFPRMDDWDYAATAKELAETGRFHLSDWPSMTLWTHAVWGAVWIKAFGFSYPALRCANMVAGLGAAWCLSVWTLRRGRPFRAALFLGLWLLFSPPMFSLLYTFMTDVTGVALAAAWLLLLAVWSDRETSPRLAALSVLGGVACLARETAAAPYLVFCGLFFLDVLRRRAPLAKLFFLVGPGAALAAVYYMWRSIYGAPYTTYTATTAACASSPLLLTQRGFEILVQLGLYTAPLTLPGLAARRSRLVGAAAAALAAGAWSACNDLLVSKHGCEFFDFGLGPDTLFGNAALCGPQLFGRASLAPWAATLLGASSLGAAIADSRFALRAFQTWRLQIRGRAIRSPAAVVWLSAALLFATSFATPYFFDRYLIPILLLAGAGWASAAAPRRIAPTAWALLILTIGFDVVAIQDCLLRRTVAQRAIHELLDSGVSRLDVNAGLEFAGVYRFTPMYRGPTQFSGPYLGMLKESERRIQIADYFALSYYRQDAGYTVGWKPAPGQKILREYPLVSWLRRATLFVSKNTPDDRP